MIVRVRPDMDGQNRYGDPEATGTKRLGLPGAFVAPSSSEDITGLGRHGVITGLTLFAPAGTDLVHTDQVEVDGVLYDIDGEVARWSHPWTGWEPGVTAALKRTQG